MHSFYIFLVPIDLLYHIMLTILKNGIFYFLLTPKTADVITAYGCGQNFCHPRFFLTIGPKEQLQIKKLLLTSLCTREDKLACTICIKQ